MTATVPDRDSDRDRLRLGVPGRRAVCIHFAAMLGFFSFVRGRELAAKGGSQQNLDEHLMLGDGERSRGAQVRDSSVPA